MDEINVQAEFENASDRAIYERGYIPECNHPGAYAPPLLD